MTLAAKVGLVDRPRIEIDIEVAAGETVALLGPNGAGKTTLLRTVAGLRPIDTGSISIGGRVVDEPASDTFVPVERRGVGFVFQDFALFAHLDVRANVAFGMTAKGVKRSEAVGQANRWIDRMDLGEVAHRDVSTLSGGQAQRVALARALASDPEVLLLDEPLSALDAQTRRDVRRDLGRFLAGFDGPRLLVTHDPVDAYALADRVAVVEAGAIAQIGTLTEITSHPRSSFVAELVGTNLVRGQLSADGLIAKDGLLLNVRSDFVGPAFATIRPQSVVLALEPSASSARISLDGVIAEMTPVGDRVRVRLQGSIELTAEVTASAVQALGLELGNRCYAHVKATDVAVYPD